MEKDDKNEAVGNREREERAVNGESGYAQGGVEGKLREKQVK